MPLPPYIRRPDGADEADQDDYQTLFATHAGAVAAPTAGLHFTDELRQKLISAGINFTAVTLHVGAGTFLPVKTENIHETMLALSHADLSFKLMVQVRNKALEAYQEVMRMQV